MKMVIFPTLLLSLMLVASAATVPIDDPQLSFSCTTDSEDCYNEGGTNFQLTEHGTLNSRSAIWANTEVNLNESFVMETQIMMDSEEGGEGMALVFQKAGSNALGLAGNGKGYEGLGPCVAIDIDTNTEDDYPDAWISITKDSPANVLIGTTNIVIKNLKLHSLRVEYDASSKEIAVSWEGQEVLTGTVDLAQELLGSTTATWGFTASSGDSSSSDQWVYFQSFENPPTSSESVQTSFYLKEDFNSETTKWTFHPNIFYTTSASATSIHGERNSDHFGKWYDGDSSGGLRLQLISGPDDASGGWETDLLLEEPVESATLTFSYKAHLEGFSLSDSGQILAQVDESVTVVKTLQGGSSSGVEWARASVDLGALAAGFHAIYIGGFLSAPSSSGEVFQIRFDNLSVTGDDDTNANA